MFGSWMAFSRAGPIAGVENVSTYYGTDGQPDVVGAAGAHPDELLRWVMTTHPAAMDAFTRLPSGGAVDATKYRKCGNRCIGRGPAQEGTRLNAEATKTALDAEIPVLRSFNGCLSGVRDLGSVCVAAQLAERIRRRKGGDATTGGAASGGSRICFAHSLRRWTVEEGRTCLSQAPFLDRAGGGQMQYSPVLFAIAGT